MNRLSWRLRELCPPSSGLPRPRRGSVPAPGRKTGVHRQGKSDPRRRARSHRRGGGPNWGVNIKAGDGGGVQSGLNDAGGNPRPQRSGLISYDHVYQPPKGGDQREAASSSATRCSP